MYGNVPSGTGSPTETGKSENPDMAPFKFEGSRVNDCRSIKSIQSSASSESSGAAKTAPKRRAPGDSTKKDESMSARSPPLDPTVAPSPRRGSDFGRKRAAPTPLPCQPHGCRAASFAEALRHLSVQRVLDAFAEMVCAEGPLTGDTKLVKTAQESDVRTALGAPLTRWFLRRGWRPRDPVLPHTSSEPVDMYQLPMELEQAGIPRDRADAISERLSEIADHEVEQLHAAIDAIRVDAVAEAVAVAQESELQTDLRLSRAVPASRPVSSPLSATQSPQRGESQQAKARDVDTTVPVEVADTLRSRYLSDVDEGCFWERVYAYVLRYGMVTLGLAMGFQMGAPRELMREMTEMFGTDTEAFASPFNATYGRYYSAFPDTDAPFGSLGSFFDAAPRDGSYEANPPFVDSVMTAATDKILWWLESTRDTMFVVFMPAWPRHEGIRRLTESSFLKGPGRIEVAAGTHYYRLGNTNSGFQASTRATYIFLLQTQEFAQRVPITDAMVDRLLAAFVASETPACLDSQATAEPAAGG